MTEIFGLGKKKPEVYLKALKDAGLSDRQIRSGMPNLPQDLADDKVDPADVIVAVKELLKTPDDHIAGAPSGKSIYKMLKKMGVR